MNKENEKSNNRKKKRYKGHITALTIKNIKTMFRDRTQMLWIIGYPFILIVVFSLAFGFTSARPKYDVIIFNEDPQQPPGDYSFVLIGIIETNLTDFININDTSYTPEEAEKKLKFEEVEAIIRIPTNFTEAILNNETAKISITTIPDMVAEGVISSIIKQIVDNIIIIHNNGTPSEIETNVFSKTVQLTSFDYTAPGFIIAGITVCISQLALHFAEEKETGTLKRLNTTPVAKRNILFSGMISQLLVIVVQIAILILLLYLFGAYFAPGVNFMLLILVPLLFAFTCLGFGLLLASFTKSQSSAGGLSWFIILPLQFLGGVFFLIDNPVSDFIPTTYANHAMRLIMVSGVTSWEAIGNDILVLIGFGSVLTILGIILFQRRTAIL
jgi:ABC-2 type transport system permease protein